MTPKLSTLDSPARVVVDLPETVMATGQSRIAVGAAGVKGVRIGMDGQTHPTTRIVVDLDQACAYELTPGPAGKLVLTLHANAVAKAAPETRLQRKTVAASSPVPASPAAVAVRAEVRSHAQGRRDCGHAYGFCVRRAFVSGQERRLQAT